MSHYIGEKDPEPILAAAAHWRDVALLGQGSVFTDKGLWTPENLDALDRHFVQSPDEGERKFIEKLTDQLAPTSPAAKQLAAEMLWFMYLCPSNISRRHKREVIQTVWSWSGEQLSNSERWLADNVLDGIGSGGPGFNQYFPRELQFLVNFTLAFRRLPNQDATNLLKDGWAFAEWLQNVPDSRTRQLRHMILFLLFPDNFERIFGQRDRRAVALAFSGKEAREINNLNPVELDRLLRTLRTDLEAEYGTTELDFYLSPLKDRWRSEDLASIKETITADAVRDAIAELDREGVPAGAESTGYDLIEGGRRYPPKLVLSVAAKYAGGEELDRGTFSGGEDSTAFRVLRKLGFEIEPKDAIPELISKFISQAQRGTELRVHGYPETYRDLTVRVSFGKGNIARIPWIAFLAREQAVSNGIYPVFLLFREQNVLLLCYGVSEENPPTLSWGNLGGSETVRSWFKKRFNRDPDRYGASYVKAAYELAEPLAMDDLNRELDLMIDQYKQVVGIAKPVTPDVNKPIPLPEIRPDLAEAVRSFAEALRRSHVTFGANHDNLVRSFIASLATKPFVILTGLSGSGKTQIAIRLGEWLGPERLHVAAVRPDWTGAEALFGYEDGLKPAIEGRAAWSVPDPLAFMLRAAEDPEHPYLLLLDEMNLAHVERYFADMLSGMESGKPCLPNLSKGSDGIWRRKAGGAAHIDFPRNLWVIGTVNVDETTYMFSPKVLDRANTFELRVEADDLQADARKPLPCEPADDALVRGMLAIGKDDSWQETHPSTFKDSIGERLRHLHQVLGRYGMEFGHRAFYESLRFAALAEAAGLNSFESVLDRIVIQKVLPRLHGSRRRLELPLLALAQFCRDLPEAVAADEKLPALNVDELAGAPAKLPLAYDKVRRLLLNLRTNQFASFTE